MEHGTTDGMFPCYSLSIRELLEDLRLLLSIRRYLRFIRELVGENELSFSPTSSQLSENQYLNLRDGRWPEDVREALESILRSL